MDPNRTTAAVQGYLDELARASASQPSAPLVKALIARSVSRLELLCGAMLHKKYPRLTRPPLNLETDELLGAVVERMIKAMREVRPGNVRQFFALANQHVRWELNDLARRLDERAVALELRESFVQAPREPSGAGDPASLSGSTSGVLKAIEELPGEEREVLELVRIQGMTHGEAADVLGCSPKTVQRRLNRAVILLSEALADRLSPPPPAPPGSGFQAGAPV